MLSDAELYRRGTDTVLACSEAYTSGTSGAAVRRLPGLAARSLRGERAQAVAAMEAAYADAGLARFAAWVHESDRAMAAELERRGYAVAETTRAMSLELSDIRLPRPELKLASPDWDEYLSRFEPSRGLLAGADLTNHISARYRASQTGRRGAHE
jgi:hypothetical protein